MKVEPLIIRRLEQFETVQNGVFETSELKQVFQVGNIVALNQKLKPYLRSGILRRFCRGYYVTQRFGLEALSQKISPSSVISFGNVLAREMLIGSIPHHTVYAVKPGPSRTYSTANLGTVVHFGFSAATSGKLLSFGKTWKGGVCYADKERAFLDTLYFHQRGNRFSFNVYSDIRLDLLDQNKIKKYLRHYKNPKFHKFVWGVLHG